MKEEGGMRKEEGGRDEGMKEVGRKKGDRRKEEGSRKEE